MVGLIMKQVSKLPNCKSLEKNGLERYFLQNDKSTRQKVAEFYNECLQKVTVRLGRQAILEMKGKNWEQMSQTADL